MQSAVDAESSDLPDFITKHVGLPGDIQRYNFSKNRYWVSVIILQSHFPAFYQATCMVLSKKVGDCILNILGMILESIKMNL